MVEIRLLLCPDARRVDAQTRKCSECNAHSYLVEVSIPGIAPGRDCYRSVRSGDARGYDNAAAILGPEGERSNAGPFSDRTICALEEDSRFAVRTLDGRGPGSDARDSEWC